MTTRTLSDRCEADVMDREVYGAKDDAVPPCKTAATVHISEYALCDGCASALQALTGIADECLIQLGSSVLESLELDSPNYIPPELDAFRERGFKRKNRLP